VRSKEERSGKKEAERKESKVDVGRLKQVVRPLDSVSLWI
jgi:hypothetical protein